MALSDELISQFAKLVTKTDNTNIESTVYGTIVVDSSGNKYVKLDGSDQLTPLSDNERPAAESTTANVNEGERVSVLIKNHTATVTGNVSSPAARSGDVEELGDQVSKIQEFNILIGEQIQAQEAYIKQLQVDKANIADLRAAEARITNLEATKATIEELNAVKATIDTLDATKIDADVVNANFVRIDGRLEVVTADIANLEVDYGNFKEITTNSLTAHDAEITRLDTEKLDAEQAEITYANIDFANITEAAVEKLFSDSGIIKDLIVSDGKITGELVGVTLKGDLVEAGTLKADKLVVKGSDGLYYKLNIEAGAVESAEVTKEELQNGLHGTAIIAKSITAEKIAVDDLVAFGATIGGFHITDGSIYSGVKAGIDNTTTGVYLDSEGQVNFGDGDNYLKYYKDEDGTYRLEISANSMFLSACERTVESLVEDLNTIGSDIVNVHESVSQLTLENSAIKATVTNVENTMNDVTGELDATKSEVAAMKLTSESLNLRLEDINYNGASKVVTETGFTFDREGMTVDSSDSATKTQVTPDGMTVYTKNADGGQSEVLEATSEGVDATNLHAKTYLIIGGRSRFENYGTDRTGCFWIGG